ncbi:DUF6452 family protein [Psychroserpens sp. SPM9]|uniref:DUF6452 family protein n=1 Tax=Psychroserpens sp. SPM9 TaxID=2975598 RepID=UPI0021A3F7F3|nr:DUF6452 family protein [Psychroserpens sp. SPM9]MDG5491398.1 DUF6452 family protein [Psychroserpens sp. SPM9]
MKRIIILLSLSALVAIIAWSCERDDICSEDTPTTPHLIIRFYDINNQDETKQVRQLEIDGLDDDGESMGTILSRTNTDSIVLPLRFANENVETITRFQLEKDADFADNSDDSNDSNIDFIEITYTPEFIYVSRACGYKSIFNLRNPGGITQDIDSDNWIVNTEILNETIENENAAHIIIYH